MAVTLWKAEYHHLAFLDEVMGSQSSMACSFSVDMLEGAIVSISDGRRHEGRRGEETQSVRLATRRIYGILTLDE
jgi:hypothetical protein